jgi:oligopeptide/dipeptide ABC transporter ATP-binding protein
MEPLLKVEGLCVQYVSREGAGCQALRGVGFEIKSGEVVGILGESGGGKSTLSRAILRVLPASARSERGSIRFQGRELIGTKEPEMRRIRGAQISLVQQDPAAALNPLMRVGTQVSEVLAAHHDWSKRRCREAAKAAMREAGLENSDRVYSAYPHQLSGGQRQRVVIAQALACRPALLIADEPTSSLDTTTQAEILCLLKLLRDGLGLAILFISHDPGVLAEIADRILVLYAGEIVEEGSAREILNSPLHPYTRALLRCVSGKRHQSPCKPISGNSPDLHSVAAGCAFEPRCEERIEICSLQPPKDVCPSSTRRVRCFKYEE